MHASPIISIMLALSIQDVSLKELRPGKLATIFSGNVGAVVVHLGQEIRRIWAESMESPVETLPWEATLFDMARNYHGCEDITTTLGDMFYVQPGAHGYYARKFEISRNGKADIPCVNPAIFWQSTGEYRIPKTLVADCCALVDQFTEALVPEGRAVPSYRVAVQRLKFHSSSADYEQLAGITANSLGRWGRLSFRVDAHRQALARPLKARGVSDVLGWMMAVPLLRQFAMALNSAAVRRDRHQAISNKDWVIEGPHYDNRYFSALAGDRRNVRSEIYWNEEWHPLPISRETITLFPGRLAQRELGLRARLHRVVLERDGRSFPAETRTTNTTLLLGAV